VPSNGLPGVLRAPAGDDIDAIGVGAIFAILRVARFVRRVLFQYAAGEFDGDVREALLLVLPRSG
jgi:hypothetical protein